jgi:hypothetical protein
MPMPGHGKESHLEFDADLSPEHEVNREAAEEQGLVYDPAEGVYRDEDGCPTLDRYGQPLG